VTYYVYILTNITHTVLYTGVTNNIDNRVFLHKVKYNVGFTSKYNCTKLVYYEEFFDPTEAIHREKQLKKYRRDWKRNLISTMNPQWKDLSNGWYPRKEFESFRKTMLGNV
jgi:putative endonuclease